MLRSNILRWRPVALALVAAAVVALTSSAQTASRWTDPTGGWSIDYMSSGWGRADGLPSNGPVLLTLPMQAPPDNETRMCLVEQGYSAVGAGASAAEVQQRGAQVDVQQAETALQRFQLTQTRVGHANVDGVAVATVDGESGGHRFRGRIFVTAAGDNAVLSIISCISAPGMTAERDAEIDVILQSLHFSPVGPTPALSLLAPGVDQSQVATSSALSAQLAEMLTLYRDICFNAFPDESFVSGAMSARHARVFSQAEVRRYLNDDPGVGWAVTGSSAEFVITVERPPFNTCAIRTMTAAGFPDVQPYVDFVARMEASRTATPIGHIDRTIGNVRSHGQGDEYAGADGSNENLLVFISTPASGAGATEVRFARQLVSRPSVRH